MSDDMKKFILLMVIFSFVGVCFGETIDVIVVHKVEKKKNNDSVTDNGTTVMPQP